MAIARVIMAIITLELIITRKRIPIIITHRRIITHLQGIITDPIIIRHIIITDPIAIIGIKDSPVS